MAGSNVVTILAASALLLAVTQALYLQKRVPASSYTQPRADTRKRPFCNAFTGCGRKRSDVPALPALPALPSLPEPEEEMENLGTLLDLSAEPAVEKLSRQIMSEAKLWEAIQEANMEIMRQKQEGAGGSSEELVSNAHESMGNSKCALPSCIAI